MRLSEPEAPPVCFGMLLGSKYRKGDRVALSPHGRDGHAPFFCDAKSNFKETMILKPSQSMTTSWEPGIISPIRMPLVSRRASSARLAGTMSTMPIPILKTWYISSMGTFPRVWMR